MSMLLGSWGINVVRLVNVNTFDEIEKFSVVEQARHAREVTIVQFELLWLNDKVGDKTVWDLLMWNG